MDYRHPNALGVNESSRAYEEIFGAPRKREPARTVSTPAFMEPAPVSKKPLPPPTRRLPRKPLPFRSTSLQPPSSQPPAPPTHQREASPVKNIEHSESFPSVFGTSNNHQIVPLTLKDGNDFGALYASLNTTPHFPQVSNHAPNNSNSPSLTWHTSSGDDSNQNPFFVRRQSQSSTSPVSDSVDENLLSAVSSVTESVETNLHLDQNYPYGSPVRSSKNPFLSSNSRLPTDDSSHTVGSHSFTSGTHPPIVSSNSAFTLPNAVTPAAQAPLIRSVSEYPANVSPPAQSLQLPKSTSNPADLHLSIASASSHKNIFSGLDVFSNVFHGPSTTLRDREHDMRNRSFDHSTLAHYEAVKQQRLGVEPTARSFTLSSYKSRASGNSLINDRSSTTTPTFVNSEASSPVHKNKRRRRIYAALLSRVASELLDRLQLGDITKDGLIYSNAFTGDHAVTVLMGIIHTSDRNLALLVGRSLDAQKFIHDVTYDHRLRDSHREIYQLQGTGYRPFLRANDNTSINNKNHHKELEDNESGTRISSSTLGDTSFPNGIFTLLTHCYSPTCAKDHPCYSISCPRRLEQQHRLFAKMRANTEQSSSLAFDDKEQKLWIHSVPQEIAYSVSDRERKRQEVICEVIYTERDFVKDLEYLRDYWIKPLWASSCIPERKKEKFIRTVFLNALEVQAVNSKLAEALTKRQNYKPIVDNIADIFLEHVPKFEPFIRYGAGQLYGKYEFEKEKSSNPAFAKFVSDVERLKESRKLELNGYLTKPTTRLARYPLLLEAVLKYTDEGNPDKQDIPKVINIVRGFLSRLNVESGKAENKFNLFHLNQQLVFKPGEHYDLHLLDANRQLIFKGPLKKRSAGSTSSESASDVTLFLFDHALLIVKPKTINKRELLKVFQRPIPLLLLQLFLVDDNGLRIPYSSKQQLAAVSKAANGKPPSRFYPFSLQLLGRRGYEITLYATTEVSRDKWLEHIDNQQTLLQHRNQWFESVTICSNFFVGDNKVNAIGVYDSGRRLLYGTDTGVYVSLRKANSPLQFKPVRALNIPNISQLEVIEEYSLLLLLSDKVLYSYPLEMIDADTTQAPKKARKVSGHTTFFRVGICLGKVLVCAVKSSVLSATIKVFEPVTNYSKTRNMPSLKKFLTVNQDPLRIVKELYIPTESTSVHFLKNKLCVGCTRGFEVVSLDNLETQSLLDPADTSLEFVEKKENVKPIAIYRMNGGEFLLCYSQFAFYVNRDGWRSRPTWFVVWEGSPQNFALSYPYILAFEPTFIEIRHVETSELIHVISGRNIRLLADGRGKLGDGGEIFYACDQRGENCETSVVCSLRLTSAAAHAKEQHVDK
ncbi:RhoGEF for Rho1 [Schizosaccharomyces pombe]